MTGNMCTCDVTVHGTAAQVWVLLCNPARHHEFDDTGMVGDPVQPDLLTRVGQVFTMRMTYRAGTEEEHYLSDNHVTAIDPERSLAWMTATHEGPVLGWTWRYDLTTVRGGVQVSLTYDWALTSVDNRQRFGVPLVDADGLRRSLHQLAKLVGLTSTHQ